MKRKSDAMKGSWGFGLFAMICAIDEDEEDGAAGGIGGKLKAGIFIVGDWLVAAATAGAGAEGEFMVGDWLVAAGIAGAVTASGDRFPPNPSGRLNTGASIVGMKDKGKSHGSGRC